ncbi:MAG TPA: DEAD/DEAH box helicase [Mycobacteriales bacterium]
MNTSASWLAAHTRSPRPSAGSLTDAGLPAALVTALRGRGITELFPIQAATLPDALAGEHVLGRARTGSGKTLGFGLPTLTRLAAAEHRTRPTRPRGLVVVPTRELAQQVADALSPLASALRLRLTTVYGGTSLSRQINALRRGVDIVVATPGRLTDLIERGTCALDEVAVTVLDEADHMCDLGFLPAVRALLAQVPADGQRMLFSATLDNDVQTIVREYLPEPVLVALDDPEATEHAATHHLFEAEDPRAKFDLVAALAGGLGRTLLFSRTKHGADRLARQLTDAGILAGALHGGLAQNARTRQLRSFAEGSRRVLVATDVAARGIHVDHIDLVVHVDPPTDPKTYLHRSGRTARAGAEGTVVVVALRDQRQPVERMLHAAGIDVRAVPMGADDPQVRELVGPPAPRETLPVQPIQPARPAQHSRQSRSDRASRPGRVNRRDESAGHHASHRTRRPAA